MAWISLGKLVLFVSGLVFLISQWLQRKSVPELDRLWSVRAILLIIAAFAASLWWSEATPGNAVQAFSKHGKLLEIALLVCLIRSQREARIAALAFFASQAFFILSSWLMVAGWRVPWATSSRVPEYKYVVFSSYLDQTLIFAAAAAVLWHLRSLWPQPPWLRRTAATLAVAALINILFFQEGRAGYVAALAVLTLALMWQIPPKWRLTVLVAAPLALGLLAYGASARFQHRMTQVVSESQNYRAQGDNATSSGFRIHAWRRSLEAMAERPASGHGVGSWTLSVKRLEGASAAQVFGQGFNSNPHQEFLLWGVELGIGGILLLLLLLACLVRDALGFVTPVRRATLSVLAVLVVACLFNSALYDSLIGDFFCVTLGMLLALGVGSSNVSSPVGPRTAIAILVYHQTDAAPPRGAAFRSLYVTPAAFARQMRLLKLLGYQGLSMSALLPYLQGEKQGKVVGITFDDGYLNNLTHALPVLQRLGFSSTCYVVSQRLGQSNDWDKAQGIAPSALMDAGQLRQWMAGGQEVGAHTRSHVDLTACAEVQAQNEIKLSKVELQTHTGRALEHFCYPYGRYAPIHALMAREAGFTTATTTQRGRYSTGQDWLQLPRVPVLRSTTLAVFWLKVATAYEDRSRP